MYLVYSINSEDFIPISVNKDYIFRQYEAINSFVIRNLNAELGRILTKPIVSGDSINFYTEYSGEFIDLQLCKESLKYEMLVKYNKLLHEVNKKCQVLKTNTDEDSQRWSTLLKEVFNLDHNLVLTNGDQLVLIWGWKFKHKDQYLLPFEHFDIQFQKEENSVDPKSDEENTMAVKDEEKLLFPFSAEENHADAVVDLESDSKAFDNAEAEILPQSNESVSDFSNISSQPMTRRSSTQYWWLIVLIVAVLLLSFGYFQYFSKKEFDIKNYSSKEIDLMYEEVIPEKPRHRVTPIDFTNIIDDRNSNTKYVPNLINLALKKKTDNFKHFAIELKQLFKDDKYNIVYYDDETSRLQLEFPEDERSIIKEKIKSNLKSYEVLIWNESIFSSVRIPNDPSLKNQSKCWHLKTINAEKAWDVSIGDTSVVIAVIDDGFDLDHEELRGKIVHPYNVVTDNHLINSNGISKHGTHVAAIALANSDNGIGISGVAPGCRLMPIQAAGESGLFTMTDIIDGVLYAIKHDADVINMSLGKEFSSALNALSPNELELVKNSYGKDEAVFWDELFSMADQNNVTIVIAAGNQNLLTGIDPMVRSEKSLKVVATDKTNNKAYFSNYFKSKSSQIDFVSSPGVNIYSATPNNNYEFMDGTSMATPIVSGAVALMKSVNPKLSNKQIMAIIKSTSFSLSSPDLPPLIQLDKAIIKAKNNVR